MQIDQKAVFDNILFTTAAEKLKTAAGDQATKGLRKLAKDLHDKARQLHSAATAGQGKDEAQNLATAVGADETDEGLRKKLKELAGANDPTLFDKAKDVKTEYGKVSLAFNAVKEQNRLKAYTNYQAKYQAVEKAWNAFNNVYNTFDKYAIAGGHQVRALIDAKKYDIQGNAKGKYLDAKATELESAANTLKTTAEAGATDIPTTAGQLRDNAQQLNTDAGKITSEGTLAALQPLASQLAKAAGTTSTSGLAKAAEDLKTAPNDANKATEVIDAFDKVKAKYDDLMKKANELGKQTAGKVQAVETQYQLVKDDFEALCKALINKFATQVATNATTLASPSGTASNANNVIKYFEVVEMAYKALNETDKANVESEFKTVKHIYDRILNLTKLLKAATALKGAADRTALTEPARELNDAAETLQGTPNVANAQQFKDKYDAFKDTGTSTIEITTGENSKKDITGSNITNEDLKHAREIKNWIIIIPSIIIKCYLTDNELKAAAGTQATGNTLRGLALALYQAANKLDEKVKKVDSNLDGAKVLKYKAGNESQKTDPKYLRKLAENLHDAADALYGAVTGDDDSQSPKKEAKELKEAVGDSEDASGKLRAKLKELAKLDAETRDDQLKQKAREVGNQYDKVSLAFGKVQEQTSKYTGAAAKAAYDQVVKAWNDFNDVYNPEEQLATAVGSGEGSGITKALKDLYGAGISDLTEKAKAVKDAYGSDWGGLKQKYNNVVKQENVYNAENNNIKAKYTQLVSAWNNFNKLYREVIYPTKFWSIIVPSIFLFGGMLTSQIRILWTSAYTIMEHFNETGKIKFKSNTFRDIEGPTHKDAIAAGTEGNPELATEDSFRKYWHLLPPNNYDSDEPSKVFPYDSYLSYIDCTSCRYILSARPFFTDAYDTTRNTSVTFSVNLSGGSTGFQSSGTIIITVGGTDFKELGETSTTSVTISLSEGGSSIKKYKDKEKPPDDNNLTPFTSGTNENLTADTKLYIQATGTLSANGRSISGSEVTIKGTVTVTKEGNLSTALNIGGSADKDPSSNGLSGTITPQGSNGKVEIQNGSITLKDKSLEALQSLTQNVVTLSGGTGSKFRSGASIIVTRTSGNVDLSNLTVTDKLEIDITGGSIKRYDNNNQLIDLTTGDRLPEGTQLSLEANGTISQGGTGTVTLKGTIVVTNKDEQKIGTSLDFGGGPNTTGVTGSLTLTNDTSPDGKKYVKIQNSSSLTITEAAYGTIKQAADTTSSSFTIGAADPRNIDNPHTAAIEEGTGDNYKYLATEYSFTKYWHLLPSDMYDKNDLPDWEVVSPTLVVLVATIFPPMIVVILQITDKQAGFTGPKHSPKYWEGWGKYSLYYWHLVDVLIVTKITLEYIFKYSLNYRESDTIIISFAAAVMWTVGYGVYKDGPGSDGDLKHIFTYKFDGTIKPHMAAPLLIVLVGMGLVYAIYPGIAPGMIVPFYLIDKIEMVLLIATIFPALGVAMVNKFDYPNSPKYYEGWEANWGYHFFDLVVPIMIILATIFSFTHFTIENHIAFDPFDGKITYTTTKDIKSIIITYPVAGTVTKDKTIKAGTVKITTGTLKGGNCEFTAPTPKTIGTATQANITTRDGKATLEIDITIPTDAADTDALDALADLSIPVGPCTVKVVGKNKLTIKITYDQKDKYIKTEITLEITDNKGDLAKLGLQNTDNATASVDPAPNHLTINYKDGAKKISGSSAKPEDMAEKGMTAITKKIAEDIKKTATPAPEDHSGAKNYYSVTDRKTKILYYFTLKSPLGADAPIDDTPAAIIVDYGHIFAEGFYGTGAKPSMIFPLLIVLVGMGLGYGYYTNTQKKVTTYDKGTISAILKNLNPNDIDSITVTDSKGNKTIYKKVKDQATPGAHVLTIKKEGEGTNAFTKQVGTGTQGTKNTIILNYTKGADSKTITIIGITDTP
ncbi:Theileria-specific hypothetical membrane protein, putative [Theileria annulata]|uniref:Theileria-specific hypothetical membrane protein, putative n=1 Tax=Theileria annulata TaxID=5874 RepID=Q4UAX6_THEAN|nr:Theileria-specific hypothetical membrane protein, putative [Theileria annulata]CAI76025.1 Theileria-specific hypothetical membrane protein, putative [Theileria annulata]|eukprot:XP_955501.1 Theileria-specific hypothetical membrane protein, putative [Theileria annulata]